ncbi:MAG: hypothetical protein H6704_04085 [Myxococcales bacterium]|nr:hypothetical protein [Myxococcales bacterium]
MSRDDEDRRLADEEDELGEPIAELRDLGEPMAPGFRRRLHRRIERRQLAGDVTTLFWEAPVAWTVEMLRVLFGAKDAARRTPPKRSEDDG